MNEEQLYHVHVYLKEGGHAFFENVTDARLVKGVLTIERIREGHPTDVWGYPVASIVAFNVTDQPTKH